MNLYRCFAPRNPVAPRNLRPRLEAADFTDLRVVFVDEGKGLLYVLNGDTLLKAAFPP